MKPSQASTQLCAYDETQIFVRDQNLCEDLIGKVSFTRYLFFLTLGRFPSQAEETIVDAALVMLAEHVRNDARGLALIHVNREGDHTGIGDEPDLDHPRRGVDAEVVAQLSLDEGLAYDLRHAYAEHRADRTGVTGHREDDAVGAHFTAIRRDSRGDAACAQHALNLAVFDDVNAERCGRARISPGDSVMTY